MAADSMVERVARVICEEEWGEQSWMLVSNHSRNEARRHARIAIEAMREPTAGMVEAAERRADEIGAHLEMPPDSIWETMIDAALVEAPNA